MASHSQGCWCWRWGEPPTLARGRAGLGLTWPFLTEGRRAQGMGRRGEMAASDDCGTKGAPPGFVQGFLPDGLAGAYVPAPFPWGGGARDVRAPSLPTRRIPPWKGIFCWEAGRAGAGAPAGRPSLRAPQCLFRRRSRVARVPLGQALGSDRQGLPTPPPAAPCCSPPTAPEAGSGRAPSLSEGLLPARPPQAAFLLDRIMLPPLPGLNRVYPSRRTFPRPQGG